MAIQERGNAVHNANLGLYLDRPPLLVPERAVSTGQNFRITNGQLNNTNVGWSSFNSVNLDAKPVLLIDEFTPTGGSKKQIFGNSTDLFQYAAGTLSYLTPIYGTGTISCTNGTAIVTGTGTDFVTAGVKAGDFINILGANQTSPSAAGWYKVQSRDSATQLTLTTNNSSGTRTTSAYTIRLTFTADITHPWLSEVFRNGTGYASGTGIDRWYAANGVDNIVAWDGIAAQVYKPNLGTTVQAARSLRRFKNIMVYVAPTQSGTAKGSVIVTSAIGQPENISTLEAAQFTIYDGSDPLLAARQIGELLAIYSARTVILAQYVGSPVQFVFRTAVAGYGPRSARAIVSFPSFHLFFATDGQYKFDGASAAQVNAHVWKDITRRSSPNRSVMAQAIIDEGNAEIIWVTPLNTDADTSAGPPSTAYIGHYLEDVGPNAPMPHSTRDMPATAIGSYTQSTVLTWDQMSLLWNQYTIRFDDQQLQAAFPQILIGTNTGDIYQLGAQKQLTTTPVSFVRFSRRPLIDSRKRGIIHRIYANANFQTGSTGRMSINLRLFDTPNDISPFKQSEYDINLDGSNRFAPFRESARFVEVEFGSGPTVSGVWALEGYDMDVVSGASR